MKTFKTLALAAAVSAGLLGAAGAMAAEDGQLGQNSFGNFIINFQKGSIAKIWGFRDLDLNDQTIDLGSAATDDICVFTNRAVNSNDFKLEIESNNAFQLAGSGESSNGTDIPKIDYDIKVAAIEGKGTGELDNTNIPHGTQNSFDSGSNHLNAGSILDQPRPFNDCEGSENFRISVWAADLTNIQSGTYSDTVTLTVTPQ